MIPWRSDLSFAIPDGGNFNVVFEGDGNFDVGGLWQFQPFLGTAAMDLTTIKDTEYCAVWRSNWNWFIPDGASIFAFSMPQLDPGSDPNHYDFRFRNGLNVAAQWSFFPDGLRFNGDVVVDPANPPYSAAHPPPAPSGPVILSGVGFTDPITALLTVTDARIVGATVIALATAYTNDMAQATPADGAVVFNTLAGAVGSPIAYYIIIPPVVS